MSKGLLTSATQVLVGRSGLGGIFASAGLVLLGLVLGAGITYGVGVYPLTSQVHGLQAELEGLKAATRAIIPIEPGEEDNAPVVWNGQTGRIRYMPVSPVGFDYIVEMENMPPNRTWHVFWAIAPTGQSPLEHIEKGGEITTDAFGRGTLSGVVPLPPGKYILGNFISDKDDPSPPFTHRTWLCIRTSASFEVTRKS